MAFDYRRPISQVRNVKTGAQCCSFAHYLSDSDAVPPVVNFDNSVMPLVLRRRHVGGGDPGCMVWRDSNLRVVAIAGAREPIDQLQTIAGWGSPITTTLIPGRYNPNALTWTMSLNTFIASEIGAADVPTFIFGFSWGGSAACILTQLYRTLAARASTWAVTFGTPKFTDFAGCQELANVCPIRLMTTTDPLPYLCPTLEHGPFANMAIGILAARNWNQFRHIPGGTVLHGDGDFSAATYPPGVPLPIDVNIYDFVRLNMGEGRPHSINTYRTILEATYPEPTIPAEEIETVGHRMNGEPASIEPRGKERPRRDFVRSARSVLDSRESTTPPNIQAVERRRNRRLIHIAKTAGQWQVLVQNDPVYTATSKRDARAVANALRSLSIQLGQQPDLFTRSDLVDLIRTAQSES